MTCFNSVGLAVPNGTSSTHAPFRHYPHCELSSETRASTRTLSLARRVSSVPRMRSLERRQGGELSEPLQPGMFLEHIGARAYRLPSVVIIGRAHFLVMSSVTSLPMSNQRFSPRWTKHAGLDTIEGWFYIFRLMPQHTGITGAVIAENSHRTRGSLDDPCRRRLQSETTYMHERLSHPYDHMDLGSALSKSVCPEKWRRSREQFLHLQVGTLGH
jgi:hypothetical protein